VADLPGNSVPLRVLWVKGHPVPERPEECEPHTPGPAGYTAHLEWQSQMAGTHVQRQCAGCGLWSVWEPKDANAQ
jgi:hypothetical protein